MAKTIRDRLIEALTLKGYRVTDYRTERYIAMTKDGDKFFFIGKSGALRYGSTVSNSRPQTLARERLLRSVQK